MKNVDLNSNVMWHQNLFPNKKDEYLYPVNFNEKSNKVKWESFQIDSSTDVDSDSETPTSHGTKIEGEKQYSEIYHQI